MVDLFGPQVILNTNNCDGFTFSYSAIITASRTSDNSNVAITNFATIFNGATTSGDNLSIFTTSYNDSPYVVSVTLIVKRPDLVSIM